MGQFRRNDPSNCTLKIVYAPCLHLPSPILHVHPGYLDMHLLLLHTQTPQGHIASTGEISLYMKYNANVDLGDRSLKK